jgi:hypothetical protein
MNRKEPKEVRNVKKIIYRYAEKYYSDEAEAIMRKTDLIYQKFLSEVPDIGGSDNMLAYNLDMGLLVFAAYEASDHRMGGDAIDEMMSYRMKDMKAYGKFLNANRQWELNIGYSWYRSYKKKLDRKIAEGEWGNTWRLEINPDRRSEGFCFHLIGCPIAEFAEKNGYTYLMPHLCASDHAFAKVIHAKLIRTHTVALGSDSCDYWYVGDESESAKKFPQVKVV